MGALPALETIEAGAPIRDAIRKMCAKDYSQLPVTKDGNCIGSVTSDSILLRLRDADEKRGHIDMGWPVEAFLDKKPPHYARSEDDLMSHVETAGTTHNQELVKNEYYLKAVNDWRKAKKRQNNLKNDGKYVIVLTD